MRSVTQKAAVALAALLVSGCTGTASTPADPGSPDAPSGPPSSSSGPSYQHYVSLGDSFTAGPYVPTTDLAKGCLRSDGNYPSLVAARLAIADFTDVSCSGADTGDLTRPQATYRETTVPAQLDALTAKTDLVTLGIGGNDFDLFGRLLRTCTGLRAHDPHGSPCTDRIKADGIDLPRQITRIGTRIAADLRRVHKRSPQARVLLVGYLRLAPADGQTCPARLPLADGDYRLARRIATSLDHVMRGAARSGGAGFVDMYAASRGHDICSATPWVNGAVTRQDAALAFHPLAAGMRAVARRILARLG